MVRTMTVRQLPSPLDGITGAVSSGDVEAVREFFRTHDPGLVNFPTTFQSKLIHFASKAGQVEVVQLLISLGADVSALDFGGMRRTPLHWACLNGEVRVVEALLDAGADPKASGTAWQELVKQRACGKHIETDSPSPELPVDLCANDLCWLAVERPVWSQAINSKWPAKFKDAVRLLLLASHESSKRPAIDLTWDACESVISRMAYPISAWL